MNEGLLRQQKERGARAQALLKNELLTEAFTAIELTLVTAWENTGADESQRREDAWRSLKLLKKLKASIESHVTTGKHAEKQLIEVNNPSKLRKFINV